MSVALPRGSVRAASAAAGLPGDVALPTITAILPPSGPTTGGTVVIIQGFGFTTVGRVLFDEVPAGFTVNSDTQITAITPPHAPGVVDVTVGGAQSGGFESGVNHFTYTLEAVTRPSVTSLAPNSGSAGGGTLVLINGFHFIGTLSVYFDALPAAFTVITDNQISAVAPPHAPGLVGVAVTNASGTNDNTPADDFTYLGALAQPAIYGLNPSSGPWTGGTTVLISGSAFTGATAVWFGAVSASFTINSDNLITAISPAAAGPSLVGVSVANAFWTSPNTAADDFTYTGGLTQPFVSGLSPASGPITGGTSVTILGSGFLGASQVNFGALGATFTVLDDSHIVTLSPAVSGPMVIGVSVTNGYLVSPNTSADDFTYYGYVRPIVSGLSPSFGPAGGGTAVTIYGSGFIGATVVNFGSLGASFTILSDTQILATSPATVGPAVVGVAVSNVYGVSDNTTADDFTYTGFTRPSVTGLAPSFGPAAGGTAVTIYGSGFIGATSVAFASTGALFTVVSDSQINAIAPAHAAGSVGVSVANIYGTSDNTLADDYTYTAPAGRPVVLALNPASGAASGGTAVVISGRGFTGATSVMFGPLNAAFTIISDSQIVAIAPAQAAGAVGVFVTSAAGTSDNTAADDYSYFPVRPELCPEIPLWTNDLSYGSPGGGFYWDPVSGMVWTAQRGWHAFSPQPARPNPEPLWVNALSYGSAGGGFWWDPISGQVWTAERSWHPYNPQGCTPR